MKVSDGATEKLHDIVSASQGLDRRTLAWYVRVLLLCAIYRRPKLMNVAVKGSTHVADGLR